MESTQSQEAATKLKLNKFYQLSKGEIINELQECRIQFMSTSSKNDLEALLLNILRGLHRVPSVFFSQPIATFLDINIPLILPCKPLHCITNHIKNLYEELSYHLNKREKKLFKDAVVASFSGKECKRGSNYRLTLIYLCLQLNGKIDLEILDVLLTITEFQEIISSAESKRTSTLILRYHNVTSQHVLLINKVIQQPKSLTSQKLFGHYYHSVIVHSPQQLRIIFGPSSNVEDEERTFNFLKTITKATLNHHPENVLLNAMISIQVKENSLTKIYNEINSKISIHDSQIKIQKTNSLFTFKFIRDNKWVCPGADPGLVLLCKWRSRIFFLRNVN